MLFNSFEFIFFFLPLCLFTFLAVASRFGKEPAILSLVIFSLFFYSWWNPIYLPLLVFSMFFNFAVGKQLGKQGSKPLLVIGLIVNLGFLAYFKYFNFFIDNLNSIAGTGFEVEAIFLPLAISFFTFQQIAYLVDSYKGITREYNFLHYSLFVSFFPQLIAGPIVHHAEMLPQFEDKDRYKFNSTNLVVGLSIFAIGFFKKTVLADSAAVYATPIFAEADAGETLDFFTAWGGALAYTFQLYFDFSGYSDMALGLARIFGIVLPLNFYSPYKAANIAEFWRRWHMTLSRFLRDYVYIPLGGNRNGSMRRYTNLSATMLLGGLWHGAGWNFVIWGALHGLYLTLHQVWLNLLSLLGFNPGASKLYKFFSWSLTFLLVVVGWVFFRATTFEGAIAMLYGMFGFNGVELPSGVVTRLGLTRDLLDQLGIDINLRSGQAFAYTWAWIIFLFPCVLLLPNTQDIFSSVKASLSQLKFDKTSALWPLHSSVQKMVWRQTTRWAIVCAIALSLGFMTLMQVSEFLYFQF